MPSARVVLVDQVLLLYEVLPKLLVGLSFTAGYLAA